MEEDKNGIENKIVKNTFENTGQKQIAGAIIIAGLIIAGAILLKGNEKPSVFKEGTKPSIEKTDLKPVSKEDHINGDLDAKIIIVEYSDLECPFCKVFHQTMHQISATNKNVAWIYRHYPIAGLHKKAPKEAEATECAWEQGGNTAFWQYTDRVFEITTSNDGLDPLELPKIAQSIGLDVIAFNTCLKSGKYAEKVQTSLDEGVRAGVRGTPKSFILVKGKVVDTIDGAEPIEMVRSKIEQALK